MLNLDNERMVDHLEEVYNDPDYYIKKEYDEDEEFNRADEEYAERRFYGE